MRAVSALRAHLIAAVNAAGLRAMEAFPSGARRKLAAACLVVSVQDFKAAQPGFSDYLGERLDTDTGAFVEVYGRRLSLCFSLDVYAPLEGGQAAISAATEQLCALLEGGALLGCSVGTLSFGALGIDKESGLLRCAGTLSYEGLVYAQRRDDGSFLDFEVKGGLSLG